VLQAQREKPLVAAAVARVRALPPGPLFSDTAAVFWFADRSGVWSPLDDGVEAELRRRVPKLREATWVRLENEEGPAGR
jgi:hypothetical protein